MALITESIVLDVIMLFASLIIFACLYMTRNFKYWKKRGVSEISPIPFIGNFGACLIAKKTPGHWIQDIYEFGSGLPYVGLYIFDKPFLLIRDPKLLKNTLVKDFNNFQSRHSQTNPKDRLGSGMLFFMENPAWKILRAKLTPIYTSGRLKKMFDVMVEVGDDLTTYMNNLKIEGIGNTLEVKEFSAKLTTDFIAIAAFGVRANCLNNPEAEFRKCGKKLFELSFYRCIEFLGVFFAPNLIKPFGLQLIPKECEEFMVKTITDVMNERELSGYKRNDLIDVLIELKNMNDDPASKKIFDFNSNNLVAQAAIFFAAGFETTSTTISLTLYELALQRDIQLKLREEIAHGLTENNGKITYNMIMNLPYMDMCIAETLRKYPPVPFIDRKATETYKIPNSNLVLEKGTPIIISILGLHYNPEYFPDPQKYDPDRFTEENKKTRSRYVYLPFGEGPRSCLGMRLANLQAKLAIVKLLSEYEFLPCKKTSIPLQFNKFILTSIEDGIFLNVRKIASS